MYRATVGGAVVAVVAVVHRGSPMHLCPQHPSLVCARRRRVHDARTMTDLRPPRILTVREYGYDQLRGLQRVGEVERIRRGSYREPTTQTYPWKVQREALLARCAAVAERLTTRFAFSHRTGAALHRWPVRFDPGVVEISQVGNPNGRRGSDIIRHFRPTLTDDDIVLVHGLPVLAPRLNAISCAQFLPPRQGLAVVDKALQQLAAVDKRDRAASLSREAVVRAELQSLLAASGVRRNVVRAREVLRLATGLSGSPQESQLRWLALAIGLPEPICEWEQWIDGNQYFSDLAWLATAPDWPRRAITLEYDGESKYGPTPESILRAVAEEKWREDAIESADVVVHRVTKHRLHNTAQASAWLLSKFPASTRGALTPRPALGDPLARPPVPRR